MGKIFLKRFTKELQMAKKKKKSTGKMAFRLKPQHGTTFHPLEWHNQNEQTITTLGKMW